MAIKPWHKVVDPREDLREGKPLDASEFAVHLHRVKDGSAHKDYADPERFFGRTYLTKSLTDLSAEVVRRLSGNKVATSAVFNMTTQFGGGKTHSLTLLYHLARGGKAAANWPGVKSILEKAGVTHVKEAATAIFVGTEFDSLAGRGGDDGTPLRKTPWGDIAFQLSGKKGFDVVAEHEREFIPPSSDVIRRFLPEDRPSVILMDEIINYVSRFRPKKYGDALYNFIHTLSEEVRSRDNAILVVSVPASELEMTSEDYTDQDRFKKLLDRVGKPIMMSAEEETSEIIRRRLFEWKELPKEAGDTIQAYAGWIEANKDLLPGWFPHDKAQEVFAATYPFHPSVMSVFERKWQALPRFQRTRGVLRLLALWVSTAYQSGFKRGQKDPLITLGSAPLDDPTFRTAVFEQLGEEKLEAAVTTDIAGKKGAHAVRFDDEAADTVRKARLHRKVATTIFFESNGGQQKSTATLPEVRLACGEPEIDVGHIENALNGLVEGCYYLRAEKNFYRFGTKAGLNKILADRQANVNAGRIDERVKQEIQRLFREGSTIEPRFFPGGSGEVENRPVLTLVVLGPDRPASENATLSFIEQVIREHGASGRTFKSALVFSVLDSAQQIRDEAKTVLAWEDIDEERGSLNMEEGDERQIDTNVKKARRDLKEAVWRTYRRVVLLGKDGKLKTKDLGPSHSSEGGSLPNRILQQLEQDGEITRSPAATLLTRKWPGEKKEWSTGAVRNVFYASPLFPRPLTQECLKEMIARGVENGVIGYVVRGPEGAEVRRIFQQRMEAGEVEFSDETFVITAEEAERRKEPKRLAKIVVYPEQQSLKPGDEFRFSASGFDQHDQPFTIEPSQITWRADGGTIQPDGSFTAGKKEGAFAVTATSGKISGTTRVLVAKEPKKLGPTKPESHRAITWQGEVPALKWTTFFTKVLAKFSGSGGLRLTVRVEVAPPSGVSKQSADEMKSALEDLGLLPNVETQE